MDKAEALRRFVRENALKLSSSSATGEVVKKLRQEYAERHNLKPGQRFRNDDVAEEVASVVMTKRFQSKDDYLSEVSKIPFVREEMSEEELSTLFDVRNATDETILKPTDLAKMGQMEFLKGIEAQFQDRARVRAAEEVKREKEEIDSIRSDLARQQEELTKFRSELDSLPPDLSIEDLVGTVELIPSEPPRESPPPWWKEIGLESDPFPSNQGLSGIPQAKYDDVVVQTPFVRNYLEAARQSPDRFMGKTVLVIGEFGSGKTTLFQYLSASIAGTRILPVNIVLNPHPSIASLTASMLHQLIAALSETCLARFGYDPRRERGNGDQYTFAADLFRQLQSEDITAGFLVMVDGLHKGREYLQQALEFLQQIQNVQEFFQQKQTRIGFLIAGSPLWQTELDRVPSLSGSFYRKDVIPPLTEDYAIEAVERRIRSFVSTSAPPPKIRRESLRMAFKVLSQRLLIPITFRDFLDHIRQRLESRSYEEIGLSVALHVETVDAVHAFLQTTPVSTQYLDMWGEIRGKPVLRVACQKVATSLLPDGRAERDPLLRSNRGAVYLLRKHKLIAQRRSDGPDIFRWHLSPVFVESILKVSEKLAVGPDEVVRAAFEEETTVRSSEVGRIYAGPLAMLQEMIPTWRDSLPELATSLGSCMVKLREIDRWMAEGRREKLSSDHLTVPVQAIVDGINMLVCGSPVPSDQRWTKFRESWITPENLESITKFGSWDAPIPSNETALFGLLHEHSQIAMQLLLLLQDLVRGEGLVRLGGRELTATELARLHDFRLKFLSQGYREVIEKSTEFLESIIRGNVYVAMRAVWGEEAFDRLPLDVQESVRRLPERGHPRTRRGRDVNFLYDVTRSQYSKILFETAIHRAVFGEILDSRGREKLKDAIELGFSLSDRTAHKDRAAYFREHATEIGDVLQAMPWVLEQFHKISRRFLLDAKFEFERRGEDSIFGTFLLEARLTPPPKSIQVGAKEATDLGRFFLERVATKELGVDTLDSTCISSTASPETHLTVLRALARRNLIVVSRVAFSPVCLAITDLGRKQLSSTPRPT